MAVETSSPVHAKTSTMRRPWFPWVWVASLAIVCLVVSYRVEDLGVAYVVYKAAFAIGLVGLAVWTVRSSGWPRQVRWPLAIIPVLLLVAFYARLLPVEAEMDGDAGIVGWRWRWEEPDVKLDLPQAIGGRPEPPSQPSDPTLQDARVEPDAPTSAIDYPGFLGGNHWPEVEGVELREDWANDPPRELWRRPIGAGWSGLAVAGDLAVTQEQRGPNELVVAYNVASGTPVWYHADRVRWDPDGGGALGGIGPRATPLIHQGRVYAHGATGLLNCLDLQTGEVIWRHDTLAKHDANNVAWGKSGSPVLLDDLVLVSVGGSDQQSLVAYDQQTGDVAWSAGVRQSSYATPTVMTLAGKRQIVCVNEGSVTAHDAQGGEVLWEHPWPNDSGSNAAASQALPAGQDRVWLSMGYGVGAQLVQVSEEQGSWRTELLWKRPVLKTKLTNVVLRDGYAYGISDGRFFQCVEVDTGKIAWRQRRTPRFGHGQILLVGDHILILCESGEVVLIRATPEAYEQLGAFAAIEGVTWNNPALSGNRLLVRNAEEAACFALPVVANDVQL